MQTYKIGNKVKCIIRSFSAGFIGEEEMQYDNQPYTILKDVEALITYDGYSSDANTIKKQLSYNIDFVRNIKISNVSLTDKILNLIYSKSEVKLCNTAENFDSDDNGNIYFTSNASEIYQVFIYDINHNLEKAYGVLDITEPLHVDLPNSNYLICYSYLGNKSVDLNRSNNVYLTLDLEVAGNINDQTSPMWIHLDKCALTADKTLTFANTSNLIDLTFKVLDSENPSYITFN